jgi:hypothetical protein
MQLAHRSAPRATAPISSGVKRQRNRSRVEAVASVDEQRAPARVTRNRKKARKSSEEQEEEEQKQEEEEEQLEDAQFAEEMNQGYEEELTQRG